MPFPPNKDPTHGFSPEALEDIRRRYVETDETQNLDRAGSWPLAEDDL
ncbi:MAG TPA: hypothetical protein VGO49_14955 [Bradyrhizobium sp.]|jgi:hypothetical protein|nr:hypothetical protein [Bradyrhizobium sp.]